MPSSVVFILFFVSITINLSTSETITFLMNDVLSGSSYSRPEPPAGANGALKPTSGGAYVAATFEDEAGSAGNSWLPILTSSPALAAGTVTVIDEEFTGNVEGGPPLPGKVQGIYVTSSEEEEDGSRIVAMRVAFANGSLRFFGVHESSLPESHLAVVGGTGRFEEVNGVAILRSVASKTGSNGRETQHPKVLAVDVSLK